MWWSNLHELVRVGEASSRYRITFNLSLSLSLVESSYARRVK